MSYTNRCFTQKLCYTQTQCFAQKLYSYVLAGPVQVLFAACRIALSRVAGGTRRRQLNFWKTHGNSLMIFAWDSPCKSAILTILEELKSPILRPKSIYPARARATGAVVSISHFPILQHIIFGLLARVVPYGCLTVCYGKWPVYRWSMMIYDYLWWFMIIYDDLWWFMMTHDDLWWFMMIYDDLPVTSCYKWWFSIASVNNKRVTCGNSDDKHW